MKKIIILTVALACGLCVSAQKSSKKVARKADIATLVAQLSAKVDSLNNVIAELQHNSVSASKPIDASWDKWQDVRYNYGFNTSEQPVFNTVNGVLESTAMLSVRGGKGRWNSQTAKPHSIFVDGGHVFEGWNASETCRLTLPAYRSIRPRGFTAPNAISVGSNSARTMPAKVSISADAGQNRSYRSPLRHWMPHRPARCTRIRNSVRWQYLSERSITTRRQERCAVLPKRGGST